MRARYTGETRSEAERGVSRPDDPLGMDSATPEQQQLRALLALTVFNEGYRGAPPKLWNAHKITVYGGYVSPRYQETVLVADAPKNVAGYFLLTDNHRERVPGIRALCVTRSEIRMQHLPTGALFTVASRSGLDDRHACQGTCVQNGRNEYLKPADALSSDEEVELEALPAMSPDARVLLAALFTRMALRDPDRAWALGNWYCPPFHIPDALPYNEWLGRQLWGAGNRWTLRWAGFPNAEYVVSALTHPVAGLQGCEARCSGTSPQVSHGDATLRLIEGVV
ncbi:hypothetical protein [Nocardiopsis tropica]|uniref:Uncharacterized protein n=1 Tax=Nocardiopsis tropica TaxID=109330 RepID=A0ABU7KMY0_9ACTN|nr:hypothetical protein [Nocardiopsis umidischolae]MEE2050642.1 hypothetical protein [Nocardiopsis umidischolae]